jgi:hypothetical protein
MNSRPEPAGCPAVSREDVTDALPAPRVAVRQELTPARGRARAKLADSLSDGWVNGLPALRSSRSSRSMPPRPPVQARAGTVSCGPA